jgi:hypothetical protein
MMIIIIIIITIITIIMGVKNLHFISVILRKKVVRNA